MPEHAYQQNEHFELQAYWSIPGAATKVAGLIKYSEEELELSLFGGLNKAVVQNPFSAVPDQMEFSEVKGTLLDGTPVTLLRAFYTSFEPDLRPLERNQQSEVDMVKSTLHSDVVMIGVHLQNSSEQFHRCRIEIPCLEDWYGESPFTMDADYTKNLISLTFKLHDNEEFVLSNGIKVRFIHSGQPPSLPDVDPSIRYRLVIEVSSDDLKP